MSAEYHVPPEPEWIRAEAAAAAAEDPVARLELDRLDPDEQDRLYDLAGETRRRHVAQLAVLGPMARAEHERECDLCGRPPSSTAADVLDRYGALVLTAIESREPAPLLLDRLDPAGHTILFGPGGVGKGTVASWWTAALVRAGHRVLIVDYENHPDEWARRIDALGGTGTRDAILWCGPYTAAWKGARGAIWRQADDLRRIAEAWSATYIVVDSIVPACGATDPTKPEASAQYAGALELIGRPALSLAHVPKADTAPVYPFGSAFWHNLARVTWNLAPGAAGSVILANRKANSYAKLGKYALAVTWSDGAPRDVLERPYTSVLADRIAGALADGPATVAELVGRLEDERDEDEPTVKADSVRAALRRGLRDDAPRWTVSGTGRDAKWSPRP